MDLERLVTALAPLEVRGGAPTDVTDLAYDATNGTLTYSLGGADAAAFTIDAPGQHTVEFRSTDRAGHAEPIRQLSFTIAS